LSLRVYRIVIVVGIEVFTRIQEMRYIRFSSLVAVLFLPLAVMAQTNGAPANCPVTFVKFDPSAISTRIQNTSGKTIVGLTFYAALADATEHWKWYHYDFDDSRPLREFGWNKEIKPMASKSLSWGADLDFEHGGGGAFVLTSVLFSDGTSWEETPSGSSCKVLWYNSHKKSFSRPVELPVRRQ
jgi:hypothetical protein